MLCLLTVPHIYKSRSIVEFRPMTTREIALSSNDYQGAWLNGQNQ